MATELHIKATITTIAKFEKDSGRSLMTAFDEKNIGVSTIVDLVKACSGATDDELDAYVAEHGMEALNTKLMDAFKTSGFLTKDKVAEALKGGPQL